MVIARPVKGKFRSLKSRLDIVLFIVFAALPFIRLGERPLILLDIPARKFHVFGITIWPQELYFLHILLITLGVMLFLFTSLFGRLWCAYGCPQSIFTDIFDWVGRAVGGKKYGKKSASVLNRTLVYFSWFILSAVIGFLFIGYFKGAYAMIDALGRGDIFSSPTSKSPATWILFWLGATTFTYINWGWFRENACKFVCPYGRFQTALLDKYSTIVAYDENRGEPRRQKGQKEFEGDCTACNLCHMVCPTGIDIRDGLQVACIRCGLCVDACTTEMGRHQKETLIDLTAMDGKPLKKTKRPLVRTRTIIYSSLLVISVSLFITLLSIRIPLYASVVRDKALHNIYIPQIGYQNGYEIHIGNKSYQDLYVKVELTDKNTGFQIINKQDKYKIAAESYEKFRLIVRLPEEQKSPNRYLMPIDFKVTNLSNTNQVTEADSLFSLPRK